MASASGEVPLKRSESYGLIPPHMSELRLVLLGNSWSQRSSVGNLILGKSEFTKDSDHCVKGSGSFKNKDLTIINSPDLLHPDLTEHRLTELIEETSEACAPGPHVFLLVLQPEDFTEQHKTRLQLVLEKFSEQAFDHSLVLISPREDTPGHMETYMNHPHLQDVIIRCRYRYIWMSNTECDTNLKNFRLKELLIKICQVLNENNRKYLEYDMFGYSSFEPEGHNKQKQSLLGNLQKVTNTGVSAAALSGNTFSKDSALRIVLFGKSNDKKTKLYNFIIGDQKGFSEGKTFVASSVWKSRPLTVVRTPNLSNPKSVEAVRKDMKRCVSLCSPGPNVLLLLVKPSHFTENNRETLKFILSLFGPDVFKHSLVVLSHDEKINQCVDDLICDCEGRFYNMCEADRDMLLSKLENIVHKNKGSYLTITEETNCEDTYRIPSLNLVLCGRRGAGKTSAAESILGRTDLSPEQCVLHQGEVCGRWVSLVELPALSGEPLETVMQQCLNCISLCGPEGVHAFILVLPVGPLTDEDKAELKTIQDTFSSRVNAFTMVLFTVDSDPTAPAVVNFVKGDTDIQELCQSCGGGHLIFNTRDQQQVRELVEYLERLKSKNKPHSYTTEILAKAQMEKICAQQKELQEMKSKEKVSCNKQTPDGLRIVVLGKTGTGKSSSGNTLLGKKVFKSESNQTSVTKICQKELSTVDGRRVALVDTPGLFDTTMSNDEVRDEMLNCVSLLAPGPHVFLLVLQIGRFTNEEKETLRLIKEGFGKEAEKFTIILFTHGDNLEEDKLTIEDYVRDKCSDSCKKLISDCGNRFHVFNNRDKNDHSQVTELMKKIDDMVKENGGGCYTNDMLQEAEVAIKKETERLMKEKEEEMRREREEMEKKYKQEMEEMKQKMNIQEDEIQKERQRREKELKEKEENIKEMQNQWKREQELREEDRLRKEKEEKQSKEWEQKQKALEEQLKMEEDSKESIDKKLENMRKEMRQKQETWENEKRELQEKRDQEDKERQQQEKIKQKEYELEKEKDEKKRLEEDLRRREQEAKERKELEENHQKQLKDLKKKHKDDAREQAEKHNEFKEKHKNKIKSQKEKHEKELKDKDEKYDLLKALKDHSERQWFDRYHREINELVKCVSKKGSNLTKIYNLLTKHEEEIKNAKEEEKQGLQKKHEKAINNLVKELLIEVDQPERTGWMASIWNFFRL